MLARRGLLACVLVMAAPAGIRAEDGVETAAGEGLEAALTVASVSAHGARIEPWVHPAMPASLRVKLEAGFELAVVRLRESASCRELFARLGADPFETLATGLYFAVDSYRREAELCGRNLAASSRGAENLAYTTVGGAATFLCRPFAWISTEKAAVAVIHEALHHAGLTEWPHDRLAMSSTEITEMVEEACGF
jgi:hypothetical protein